MYMVCVVLCLHSIVNILKFLTEKMCLVKIYYRLFSFRNESLLLLLLEILAHLLYLENLKAIRLR